MTGDAQLPIFATNNPRTGETVADAVNALLGVVRSNFKEPPKLAIATAYLNPQGFGLIAEEVERAPHVRILLGAEPEEPFRSRIERGVSTPFEEIATSHDASLQIHRDLLGFDVQSDKAARRLVAWLRSVEQETVPRVEVRRFKKGFMHGKAFIAEHPVMPAVLAGSSNLTYAGLSLNRELNLGYPQGEKTGRVIEWFNELWDESEPYDLAAMYEKQWLPHSPWNIFLRMLEELYAGSVIDPFDRTIELPATQFQRDGILRAIRILDGLGGVLVCDEVGLGKTFIAGEVIRRISQVERQKVLIVVPAALKKSTWEPFLRQFDLVSNRVEVVTFDELRLGRVRAVQNLDDYAFVVIDEAHNLRNPNAQRSAKVIELLHDTNPKKVMLLTATPVNNSLNDLHTLVNYFVRDDAHFAPIGIPSIREYIKRAQDLDPDTLSPEHLFDLMDQVAVRRTRRFIKAEYPNDTIRNNRGEDVPIVFPTPVINRIDYDLDTASTDLANRVVHALKISDHEELVIRSGTNRDATRLSMARYAPSFYSLGNDIDNLEITNVGLLRSALLKRLESSTEALIKTLQRLVIAHHAFVEALDEGFVMIGNALKEFALGGFDDIDEFIEALDDKAADQVSEAAEFDIDALRADVVGDLDLLEKLLAAARLRRQAGPDDKALELCRQLQEIAEEAERPDKAGVSSGDRRKVIIFSTYTDTIEMLRDQVEQLIDAADEDSPLGAYKGRIAPAIYGSRGLTDQDDRSRAIAGFCPRTAGDLNEDGEPLSEDRFDLLFTTDVLAEGVNLQQAGRMINFDLPWNPMRMVQRHGRIDRIGSPHARVHIGVFFPAKNLDELLKLEETLRRKVALANAAIGSVAVLGGEGELTEVLLHDVRADILELHGEDARLLVEAGGNEALSGEEYRRRLQRAFVSDRTAAEVRSLPYGSGSGFVSNRIRQAGYVFCARIGEHPIPWFRFVAADATTWLPLDRKDLISDEIIPWIEADTLTCLIAADPKHDDTARELSDEAAVGAFGAWERAQADIYDSWTLLTDPANLEPKVAKALRDAIQLVWDHGGHLGVDQEDLAARLGGSWDNSVVTEVRHIIRNEELSYVQRITALREYVTEIGLPIPEKPKPLAAVRRDDIRVVCWMAVTPKVGE
jgi:hypothetical protein